MPYGGGPVMRHPKIYAIFLGRAWRNSTSDVRASILDSLHEIPHSDFQNTLAGYRDRDGAISNDVKVAAVVNDSEAPPAEAFEDWYGTEVHNIVAKHGWKQDADSLFMMFPPPGTYRDGDADTFGCAWHNADAGLIYAVVMNPADDSGCPKNGLPRYYFSDYGVKGPRRSDEAAGAMYYTLHEYGEALTDPLPYVRSGYVDPGGHDGGETADVCVPSWGHFFGANNVEFASIWSVQSHACSYGDRQTLRIAGATAPTHSSGVVRATFAVSGDGSPHERLFLPSTNLANVRRVTIDSPECKSTHVAEDGRHYTGYLCRLDATGHLVVPATLHLQAGKRPENAAASFATAADIVFGDASVRPLALTVPFHQITVNGRRYRGRDAQALASWPSSEPEGFPATLVTVGSTTPTHVNDSPAESSSPADQSSEPLLLERREYKQAAGDPTRSMDALVTNSGATPMAVHLALSPAGGSPLPVTAYRAVLEADDGHHRCKAASATTVDCGEIAPHDAIDIWVQVRSPRSAKWTLSLPDQPSATEHVVPRVPYDPVAR
jgi:hypothetical protein